MGDGDNQNILRRTEKKIIEKATASSENNREDIRLVFDATSDLYYEYWGEFFHSAVFEDGDDPQDFRAALRRTHERYFDAIGGANSKRILDLSTGGGAFAVDGG